MFVFNPPPSKSLTNRALILASLINGESLIHNYAKCEDTTYMIRGLRKLGVSIIEKENTLLVRGTGSGFNKNNIEIYCGNAGTTLRFLTALAILNSGTITLTGSKRMLSRPIGDLVDALNQLGILVESANGYPPVKIRGGEIKSNLIEISSTVSSQFISALLLILPAINRRVLIKVKGKIPSLPYINLTLDMIEKFGAKINQKNYKQFFNKKILLLKPAKIIIESDTTSATYFFGAAAIMKKKIRVTGINKNSKQADLKFINVLKKMGCNVVWEKDSVILQGKRLKGIEVDMNDAPDSVPTLSVVSLFAKGKTKITNIGNLKFKESNRIEVLKKELSKLGAGVITGDDFIEIHPATNYKSAIISPRNDHRIAMSFAIASIKVKGLRITNPNCVKKSFPDFWTEFNKMKKHFKL